MAKQRVHEIAKALGLESSRVIDALTSAGVEVKTASSSVDQATALKALAAAGALPKKKPVTAGQSGSAGASGSAKKSSGSIKRPAAAAQSGDTGKKRRRVVIDSQAARRDHMSQGPPQRPPRRRGRRRRPAFDESPELKVSTETQEALKVNSGATVREVSETFGVSSAEVIKKLMQQGEMATLTQTLTDETVEVLAGEFDQEVEIIHASEELDDEPTFTDDEADLVLRPPVVTVMGHVDHGKTSLLDAIRTTEVAAGEAGGITQHIGAYQVHQEGRTITFLDTPGHQAFTAMRARGAKVTDVAIVVVAADDGVMPQTVEAIDHAKAADVPVMIAVNKIDKEGATPDKVRGELANLGLQPEDWGGETVYCDVSAKTHEGLDNLLHMILLVTELEDLKANPDTEASGTVIESPLDPGRGSVVTILVQLASLIVGDSITVPDASVSGLAFRSSSSVTSRIM